MNARLVAAPYIRTLVSAAVVVLCAAGAVNGQQQAQEPPPAVAIAPVPDLDAIRTAIEADTSLAEDLRATANTLLDQAAGARQAAAEAAAQSDLLAERVQSAPDRIAELREELDNPLAPPTLAPDISLERLQELATTRRVDLKLAREEGQAKEAALADLTASTSGMSDRLAEEERALRGIEEELNKIGASDELDVVEQAREAYLLAQQRLKETTVETLRRRAANYTVLVELATLERDLALIDVDRLDAALEALEVALQSKREAEVRLARQQAEAVKVATVSLPPAIAALADTNAKLRGETEEVTRKERDIGERLRTVERLTSDLETDLVSIRERVDKVGASAAVGRLLQNRLERLPSARDYRRLANNRRAEIGEVTDRRIDISELSRELVDLDAQVNAIMQSLGAQRESFDEDWLKKETREILAAKRATLGELYLVYGRYLNQLTSLDVAEQQLAVSIQGTTKFIEEQLIWIRSLDPIGFGDFKALPGALRWVLSPAGWGQALADAASQFRRHRVASMAALIAVFALFAVRRLARRRIRELGERTRRIRTDAFTHTVEGLAYTVMLAGAWPMVLAVMGWHLHADPIGELFSATVGLGLLAAAEVLFVLSLLWWVACTDGLAQRHFHWPDSVRTALRRHLRWLGLTLVPLSFVLTTVTTGTSELEYVVGLSRPLLIFGCLVLATFVWRFFKRSAPLMTYLTSTRPDAWVTRLWILWFSALLGIWLALALGSALGYQYTAREAASLLIRDTAWALLGLLLLKDFLLRWFYMSERRLRLQAAIEQRDAARAEREREHAGEREGAGFEVDVPEVNYRELGEQGRSVIRVGILLGVIFSIWFLWSGLLPAVSILERIELPFTKVQLVDGVESQLPVTMRDVGVALLVLIGTLFAARNFPGLLEFTVLRRLRLDPGGSYAIVTLCQYFFVAIGVIAAFSGIGLQWSKLQWLVAALGVGLGFGLQEIVANFVSGIILLLERPIRVGDVVTVGEASGTVARIRIRATTILTWEKKELVVPNKEFITGRLLNWTLTDAQTRLLINVGIAYGSDVAKALELVMEAAEENENVLEEPKPLVTFESFGDNALSLFLRCYVGALDLRLPTTTALHEAIYRKLNEAGISIAFPQRDIHLDTARPLDIRVLQDTPQASEPGMDKWKAAGE